MQKILARLLPFLMLVMMLGLFVVGLVVFSYLLVLGALIGIALFVVAWIKELFWRKNEKQPPEVTRIGRIIEHDDKDH